MPIYEYKCQECGKIIESISKKADKYRFCPGNDSDKIPGLIEKCSGVMKVIPSIFQIKDPWKWAILSSDGMGVIKDPGDPVEYLYESLDEQEFYEGPDGEYEYPYESIAPMRYHDNIPWQRREEWLMDTQKEEEEEFEDLEED